ncbi:MAG TPA: hypothetical protein VJ858_01570 [Acidimicrobiia bacterium]|nr:hypothetical protein [Acidimicrobiia bacterium]
MSRTVRNSALLLVVGVLLVSLSSTGLATEESGEEGGTAGSTTTLVSSGLTPAVPIEAEEVTATPVDWTYRYMIPTGLVLAAIIVLITAIKYFTDVVRKRYRIVE